MDPLVLILKYFFNENNLESDFESVESFFEDGISFPTFITSLFNVNEIPDVNQNPETPSDKEHNNDCALQFLLQNNKSIEKRQPKLDSYEDQTYLLSLIMRKICFKLNYQHITDKCNRIFQLSDKSYDTESDLLQMPKLINLLHILTDERVQNVSEDQEDINDLLKESFEEANVPLVIDDSSLESENQYQFYIQIEIIFHIYSDKVKSILKGQEIGSKSLPNIKLEETQDGTQSSQQFQSSDYQISEISASTGKLGKTTKTKKRFHLFGSKKEESSGSSDTTEYYSDEEDDKENEDLQNEALLKTINAIGSSGGIHFNDFDEAVQDDSIPKFVMFFFKINSIENVHISDNVKSKNGTDRLTKEQIDNIKAVIDFIKTKKEKFKILHFDFEDLMNVESSTILFYSNFLNCFFLKKLKQEMYRRTVRLLCTHTDRFDDKYNNILFTKYKIYPCLLHFIVEGNLHFDFNYHKVDFEDAKVASYFKKANIPMVINRELLLYGKKYVPSPIFYQLQFIFEALDAAPASRRIVEMIANAIFELKKIEVPKFVEIAASIKVKRNSLEAQKKIVKKYSTMNYAKEESKKAGNKNDDEEEDKNEDEEETQVYIKKVRKVIPKPKRFLDLCKEDPSELEKMKEKLNETTKPEQKTEVVAFDDYWNTPSPGYKYDNGFLFNEEKVQSYKAQAEADWTNMIADIQKVVEKKEEEKSPKEQKDEEMKQKMRFNRRRSNANSKLHKIFVYDEKEKKWVFDSSGFKQFSEEKRINITKSKTPLILYFNSNEKDLMVMNSNLINSIYPNLDKEGGQDIFVYALCDRPLSMLNFTIDFNNAEKVSIKPIFLLLHVPKNKENLVNIRQIVMQIYSFLSMISDFEVTVLSKDHYIDQIEFIRDIISINKSYDDAEEYERMPFSFTYERVQSTFNYNFEENEASQEQSKFVYKEPKFVILVNDSTAQFRSELDENLNKNELFVRLLSKFYKEFHLHYINIDDSNTYEGYLNCMNDIIMKGYCLFNELEANTEKLDCMSDIIMKGCCLFDHLAVNMGSVSNCHFSNRFIEMATCDDYYYSLEDAVIDRNRNLSIEEDTKSDDYLKNLRAKFQEEASRICPSSNRSFSSKCSSIIKVFFCSESKEGICNGSIRRLLKDGVSRSSESNIRYLEESLNEKHYWKIQEMADMIVSHKRFLKEELFCIIDQLLSEELKEEAFEFNFDIIEWQLEKDKDAILDILQPFIDKIDTKGRTKVRELRNTMKEGTNYTMKETENLREIKVTVQINQDLKSEIEQDF